MLYPLLCCVLYFVLHVILAKLYTCFNLLLQQEGMKHPK